MRRPWKYWPWLPPSRGDIFVAAVGVVFVAAFLILLVRFPLLGFRNNEGLGPNWDCAPTPNSEAVCVKRVPRAPEEPHSVIER
jgi:hypothetical protein